MIVTVDEVKTHLRIQHEEENEYLVTLISQAQATVENYCRVSFEKAYDTVPEPVRLAVLLMVSHYYENREVSDKQIYITMRMAFEHLLYPYRDVEKMF